MNSMNESVSELKQRYDALSERERQHREQINFMRRQLSKLSRERKAAGRAWKAQSKDKL